MAATGGRIPFDAANALTGPARVLYAPLTVTAPTDVYDIISGVADSNGEYPAQTGWVDFGLAADAPSYSHSRETEGIDYEHASGLFEKISEISRSFTAQVAEISPENLKILENAPEITTIAASANQAAQKKVPFGFYTSLAQYRIAMIAFRPDGAGTITEPVASPVDTRPPLVALVLPKCQLAAEDTELEFSREDPVNAEIQFTAQADQSLGAGKEHGFWIVEQPGTIAAS